MKQVNQNKSKERWWTRLNDWWNGPADTRIGFNFLTMVRIILWILVGVVIKASIDNAAQKNNLVISNNKSLSLSKENPNTIQSGACTNLKNCPLNEVSYLSRLNLINADTPLGVIIILNNLTPLPISRCMFFLAPYIEPIYPDSTSFIWSANSFTSPSKLCSDLQSSNISMYFDILFMGKFNHYNTSEGASK